MSSEFYPRPIPARIPLLVWTSRWQAGRRRQATENDELFAVFGAPALAGTGPIPSTLEGPRRRPFAQSLDSGVAQVIRWRHPSGPFDLGTSPAHQAQILLRCLRKCCSERVP